MVEIVFLRFVITRLLQRVNANYVKHSNTGGLLFQYRPRGKHCIRLKNIRICLQKKKVLRKYASQTATATKTKQSKIG